MRLGIDIGGTKTAAVALDTAGRVVAYRQAPSGRRNVEVRGRLHVLDAGHFALDVKADEIAALTKEFLLRSSTEKGWHSGR